MYQVLYYYGNSTATIRKKDFSTLKEANDWAQIQPLQSIIEIKHYENRTNNRPTLWR
jgi:hypothetical protein